MIPLGCGGGSFAQRLTRRVVADSKRAAACSSSLPRGRNKLLRVAPFPQHSFFVQGSTAKKVSRSWGEVVV